MSFLLLRKRAASRCLAVGASVATLRQASGPATVRRVVRAVVVFAFECQLWLRPLAHIFQKLWERVAPCVAHRDPPAAVARVGPISGIEAAIIHAAPDSILWRVSLPVRRVSSAKGLSQRAAARSNRAALNVAGPNEDLISAHASTAPFRARRVASSGLVFEQRQSSALLTDRQAGFGLQVSILLQNAPMWAQT